MKYEITEENNVILSGLQLLKRQFDSLSEYVVFSVIQTMTQARRGQYDGNIQFIADWSMLSECQARRIVHNLIKKGYVEAENRVGDTTILRAIPLSKCDPSQNATPCTGATPPLSKCDPPSKIIIESIPTSTYKSACAHAGIEKLKSWINETDLREYGERVIKQKKCDKSLDELIQVFYEDDFTVREKINMSYRTDVLKHFQNWLPRYINKQQEQLKQEDNGSKSRENSVRKDTRGWDADRSYLHTKD